MVTNGGDSEGLFRGAFMESGSPIPTGDITHGQPFYDALVDQVGCSGSSDTLECLRQAPFDKLKAAMDASPDIFSFQVSCQYHNACMNPTDMLSHSHLHWLGRLVRTASSLLTMLKILYCKEVWPTSRLLLECVLPQTSKLRVRVLTVIP